jgi:hypothetical protein
MDTHRLRRRAGAHSSPCWACGRATGCCNFFCDCGKIQPVVGHCSYYETFHLCVTQMLDACSRGAAELEVVIVQAKKIRHRHEGAGEGVLGPSEEPAPGSLGPEVEGT